VAQIEVGTASPSAVAAPTAAECSAIMRGATTRPSASFAGFHFTTRGPAVSMTVRNFGPGRSTAICSGTWRAAAVARAVVTIRVHASSSSWAALMRSKFMPASSSRPHQPSSTSSADGAVTIT
jgi:hypothetical protein